MPRTSDKSEREKESKNRPNARDMKRGKKQSYFYISKNTGRLEAVYCTRAEYLCIKLHYDINGLTPEEFEEYKAATK